jgi:hypothetical protein
LHGLVGGHGTGVVASEEEADGEFFFSCVCHNFFNV